jgi:hypothetical protein
MSPCGIELHTICIRGSTLNHYANSASITILQMCYIGTLSGDANIVMMTRMAFASLGCGSWCEKVMASVKVNGANIISYRWCKYHYIAAMSLVAQPVVGICTSFYSSVHICSSFSSRVPPMSHLSRLGDP